MALRIFNIYYTRYWEYMLISYRILFSKRWGRQEMMQCVSTSALRYAQPQLLVFPRAASLVSSSSSLNIYVLPPWLRPSAPPNCSSNLQTLAPLRSTKPDRHCSPQNQPTSSKNKLGLWGCGSQGTEGTKFKKTQTLFILLAWFYLETNGKMSLDFFNKGHSKVFIVTTGTIKDHYNTSENQLRLCGV